MTAPGSALTFTSVRVERGGRRLVDDVSFSVREQTVHALLGHNGAGKTTLMRAVAGLVPTRSGTITSTSPPSVLFVGGRYPSDLTVEQVVEHRSRLLGGADVRSAIAWTGVDEFLTTRGGALSTGMSQRLSIALALLAGAQILVLDEPTSGLDPQGVERLRGIVLGLRDAGCTVLVCSHDLAELELVCDDVTCLRRGRLTSTGPVAEVAEGLPKAQHVVRTADDALAAEILRECGFRAHRTARGLRLDVGTDLRQALGALAEPRGDGVGSTRDRTLTAPGTAPVPGARRLPTVETLEVTVDRGLFTRIYERDASEPSRPSRRLRRGR